MTIKEKITNVYNTLKKEYGEELAKDMLISILVNMQKDPDFTFNMADEIFNELTNKEEVK